VLIVAAIGYAGAAHWVSFAFVPARLLFLLPFYLILLSRRVWICATLGIIYALSLYGYYQGANFLNKGYLLPFDRIADIIEKRSAGHPAQLIVEIPGLDVSPLTKRLKTRVDQRPGVEISWVLTNNDSFASEAEWHFVRYSDLDYFAMRLLGRTDQPHYVLTLRQDFVR
jgi:hypothetical protein